MPKPTKSTQVTPKPALEKRTRRQFTLEYKLHIIAEADAPVNTVNSVPPIWGEFWPYPIEILNFSWYQENHKN